VKITILQHKIKNEAIVKIGILRVSELLKSIGISIEISFKNVDFPLATIPLNTDVVQSGYGVNYLPILNAVNGTENIACLIYNADGIIPKPTNPVSFHIKKGNTIPMEIPEFWYSGNSEVLAEFILHELCHTESFRNGKPDYTHKKYDPMWQGQFSQKSNVEYYLFLLKQNMKPSIQPTTHTYKYFKPSTDPKMVGIKHEVMLILDELRERCGFPIIITSGLRTKEENDKLPDAVEDSAHIFGLAADIYCIDSTKRDKIFNTLKDLGIVRRGMGTTFIHLDIDKSKPQNVVWLYKKA